MWGYYSAVVVVGIGFLTIGLGWTLLVLSSVLGVFFGVKYRSIVKARCVEYRAVLSEYFLFVRMICGRGVSAQKSVEQTGRRWMFPEPRLSEIRGEGFEALSECFLLLKRMAPFYTAALFEYDSETRLGYPRIYSTGSEGFRKDALLSVSDGVVGYCFSSGKTVHYPDFKGDSRLLGYYTGSEDVHSVAVFPLDRGARRVGALVIDSKTPDAFSPRMEEFQHLARLLTELMVRVQREESLVLRVEEDRTLKAMTERMAKAGVSLSDVADSLCKLCREAFPAERVTFVVFDDPSSAVPGGFSPGAETAGPTSIVRFRSLQMLDRYVELVARTRKAIRMDDLWENGLASIATGQSGITTRSMLAAPFVYDSHVIGVVLLEADRRRAFNAFHETAIADLVTNACVAIARAIEYGRMEKTCAIADVVPAAADRIFREATLEPVMELVGTRFDASADVLEVTSERDADIRLRPWEHPETSAIEPSPFQKRCIDTGVALVRIAGNVTALKDAPHELPAGADILYPLASGTKRPFGLFGITLRGTLRIETALILDRVRALIQIRLVLERRERQFGFLKVRDPLTGVFHTAAFDRKLDERIRVARETVSPFHLMIVQPRRMSALKRSHGFGETVRRFASLCAEVERLCGTRSLVGRVGPGDIGIIWEDGSESVRAVRSHIERLSDTLGFQVQAGVAEYSRGMEGRDALMEAACAAVTEVPA